MKDLEYELVQPLVIVNYEFDVAGHDVGLLIVASGTASEIEIREPRRRRWAAAKTH